MPNQIDLSPQQLAQLNSITANGTMSFAEGYRYVSGIIQNDPRADSYTKFFFNGAAEVNANAPTDANRFIRSVTGSGLAWDGLLASDPGAVKQQIDAISDAIATNVVRQINESGGIPQLSTIVQMDAATAVSSVGKQTVGGWGGAFYYWNMPFSEDGRTVGQNILADPVQYEKFIAVNGRRVAAPRFARPRNDSNGISEVS